MPIVGRPPSVLVLHLAMCVCAVLYQSKSLLPVSCCYMTLTQCVNISCTFFLLSCPALLTQLPLPGHRQHLDAFWQGPGGWCHGHSDRYEVTCVRPVELASLAQGH